VGVPERDLPREHHLVVGFGARAVRQHLDRHGVLPQPLAVRVLGRQARLDLVVGDDPPLARIHEEDPAGVEPLLDEDVLRRNVEDADFGGHDDEVVLRDVVARRPEPVPVEHGADYRAVREGDRRRPVPGLHERGMVLVEGPALRAHALVPLPGLGDHHQDGVGEGAPVHHQELEHVVEDRRVAAAFADDREDLLEVVAEEVGPAERLAGPHPVDVAAERVDLPVVGDVAVGMRERPGRERVGAEPLVDERKGRLDVRVGEIRVHRLDLVRAQHPLVDQSAGGQARDVEEALPREVEGVHGVFDPLPDHVELPLEMSLVPHAGAAADKHLRDVRLDRRRRRADEPVVGGHRAPAEEPLAFLLDDLSHEGLEPVPFPAVVRKEDEPGAVLRGGWERDAGGRADLAEEVVRHLEQDPGAVAGVRLRAARPTVLEVHEDLEGMPHDRG
jgi:hypothetical protein